MYSTEWVPGGKWGTVMVFQFQSRGGFTIFFKLVQERVMSYVIDEMSKFLIVIERFALKAIYRYVPDATPHL
jgi:hypothetical protein